MSKQSSKKDDKIRSFDIILYDDPSLILPYLQNVYHFAYILHDKDVKETGELKEPHYHLVIVFNNPRTKSGVSREFIRYCEQNVFVESVEFNIGSSFLYLMHQTKKAKAEGKPSYPIENIICDDLPFWNKKAADYCDDTDNSFSTEKFIIDLYNKTPVELAFLYGRDYIKNARAYNEFAQYLKSTTKSIFELVQSTIDKLL